MLDCVMLDIGGTFVKHSSVADGVFTKPGMFPIEERGTAKQIIETIIAHLEANPAKKIAVSMPGPADYKQGIMLMKHKFSSMYGICLSELLRREFPQTDISFVHDGVAFMLGEALFGAAQKCSSAACVMLGTGLGFALFQGGKVSVGSALTPYKPLWNKDFRSGIAEDYVSGRGIHRRWLEQGRADASVKRIAQYAKNGDLCAAELMLDTGRMLGEMLTEHLSGRPVERIVIGGQIAKSWDLMKDGFKGTCVIPAVAAMHIEDAALRGAYVYAEQGEDLLHICENA